MPFKKERMPAGLLLEILVIFKMSLEDILVIVAKIQKIIKVLFAFIRKKVFN